MASEENAVSVNYVVPDKECEVWALSSGEYLFPWDVIKDQINYYAANGYRLTHTVQTRAAGYAEPHTVFIFEKVDQDYQCRNEEPEEEDQPEAFYCSDD